MTRVVSLLPSTTEIVHALGRGDTLVGRSHECDHPVGVETLPIVTEPKFPVDGDSATIDRQVRTILEQALSVYRVHAEVLRVADPDVVLTQSQCEVCAVSSEEVRDAVRTHLDANVEVVELEPNALSDVLDDVRKVARALQVEERGERLVAAMRGRIDAVRQAVAGRPRRRVLTIEWIDPPMAAGNWMPELLDAAGADELFGVAGHHSPWLDVDAVAAADPDAVLVLPCGFDLERTRIEAPGLRKLPGWDDLRAVRDGEVFLLDGHRYFNRPGPRLAESTEILAEVLHPGAVPSRHEGDGWERWG